MTPTWRVNEVKSGPAKIRNAKIESVMLDISDHGMLVGWLRLKYSEGSGQGFGGYNLYSPGLDQRGSINVAGLFIFRCTEIGGAPSWEKLPGKIIRTYSEDGLIQGIGHVLEDDWFFPKEEFEKLKQKTGQE